MNNSHLWRRSKSLANESISQVAKRLLDRPSLLRPSFDYGRRRHSENFESVPFQSDQLQEKRRQLNNERANRRRKREKRTIDECQDSVEEKPEMKAGVVRVSCRPDVEKNLRTLLKIQLPKQEPSSVNPRKTKVAPFHRRCHSSGNPVVTSLPVPDVVIPQPHESPDQSFESSDSLSSLFYPFAEQPEEPPLTLKPPSTPTRSRSFTSPLRISISVNNTPVWSRASSGCTSPVLAYGRPIKNPTSSLGFPAVRNLPSPAFRKESIFVDRSPFELELEDEHLFLNGFAVTISDLDELYKVTFSRSKKGGKLGF